MFVSWEQIVVDLGVTLVTGALPYGWYGAYDSVTHTITMREDVPQSRWVSTLAHECGHAFYRHTSSTVISEREACVWAVRRLIGVDEFVDACAKTSNVKGIAHHLGVLPRDVEMYTVLLRDAGERQAWFRAENLLTA